MKILRYPLIAVLFLLAMLACTKVEWTDVASIKPGFAVFYDSSNYEMQLTKDLDWNTVEYSSVNIDLQFIILAQNLEYTEVGINKILYDENNNPIENINVLKLNNPIDTIEVKLASRDTLFCGFEFNPDSIRPGYYFVFQPYMKLKTGEIIYTARGDYQVMPEYINFCDLPVIPNGVYEAHNKETGFKKDMVIEYKEISPGVWMYIFTDFGLDWSNWGDFWYGTDFSLSCPLAGDDRYVVKLAAWGIDLSTIRLEMKDKNGEIKTKPLRIMPWTYADDSPDVGYYDAANKQFIFKNVSVKDTWWNIDNHLLTDITFTYKGK